MLIALTCSVWSMNSLAAGPVYGPFTAAEVGRFTPSFGYSYYTLSPTGSYADSFEGMNGFQEPSQPVWDIDPNGAVGQKQYLQWVNSRLQAYDKATGGAIWCITQDCSTAASSDYTTHFWYHSQSGPIKECSAGSYAQGDGVATYDPVDARFVLMHRVYVKVSGANQYYMCVAISSGDDVSSSTTLWHMYEYSMNTILPTDGNGEYFFPDYPKISTWVNGNFILEFDLEDASHSYALVGFEVCTLDRTDMVAGNASTGLKCYQYLPAYAYPSFQHPTLIHTALPADITGTTFPGNGSPEYFLASVTPGNSTTGAPCTTRPCTSSQLAFFKMAPGGALTGPTYIAIGANNIFSPGCYHPSQPSNTACIPEPTSATTKNYLNSIGDRLMNRLTWRFHNGINHLVAVQTVDLEPTGNNRSGINYYDVVNPGSTATITRQGTVSDPNGVNFLFMPSAAMDSAGNIGITYSESSTMKSPSLWFVTVNASNVIGTPVLIVQGSADEENCSNWGDYVNTSIDPADDLTYWSVGEYFDSNQTGTCGNTGTATFQTRIFTCKKGAGC